MLPEETIVCPYCGEQFTSIIDPGNGSPQTVYTEDCQICCRPIEFRVTFDNEGNITSCDVRREND